MAPSFPFSLLLLLAFTLPFIFAGSTAAAPTSLAANATADVKLLCTYDQEITRVVTIDKKVDSFRALQAQIATFFPDKPVNFSIKYHHPDEDDDCWQNARNYIDVTTDEDARSLLLEYGALAAASPNPVRMELYVTPPPGWDFFGFVQSSFGFLLHVSGAVSVGYIVHKMTLGSRARNEDEDSPWRRYAS